MKNKKILIPISLLIIVGLFVLASNFYKKYESKRLGFLAKDDSSIFVPDYAPQLGADSAKVFLIEYLDPECESCRMFYPKVKSLLKEFEGRVKFVVRYAPFHKNSKNAIRALEATRLQGKYWEALELLFKHQPSWANHQNPKPQLIFYYLLELDIDIEKLKQDMKSSEIERRINQDLADLRKLNVRGTPTFFVNGKSPAGFGIEYLRKTIQKEIDELY